MMSKLPYSIEKVLEMTDIGDVDTISLFLNIREWIQNSFIRNQVLQQLRNVSVKEIKGQITIKRKGTEKTFDDIYFNTRVPSPSNKNMTDYSFSYRCITGYLKITLNHRMVLGKTENMIIQDIKSVMSKKFYIQDKYLLTMDNFISLGRVDYKRDYLYRSIEEYFLIKQIIDIAPSTIISGHYNKEIKANKNSTYLVTYKTASNTSVEFVIYDKQKEQEYKLKLGKTDDTNYYKYKSTIRFEVKIQNAKLNSLKSDGIPKSICMYKTKEMARRFFNYYAERAFFTEKIYRLDIAEEIIKEKEKRIDMKDKLCKVLEEINEKGYTEVRDNYSSISKNKNGKEQKNYTKFNRYIDKIRKYGINPLTCKDTWQDDEGNSYETTYTEIPNFVAEENSYEEEALILE